MNSNRGVDPKFLNQFGYVCGDPLRSTDPTGLDVYGPGGTNGPEDRFGPDRSYRGYSTAAERESSRAKFKDNFDKLGSWSSVASQVTGGQTKALSTASDFMGNISTLADLGKFSSAPTTNNLKTVATSVGLMATSAVAPPLGAVLGVTNAYCPDAISNVTKAAFACVVNAPEVVANSPYIAKDMLSDLADAMKDVPSCNPNSPGSFGDHSQTDSSDGSGWGSGRNSNTGTSNYDE